MRSFCVLPTLALLAFVFAPANLRAQDPADRIVGTWCYTGTDCEQWAEIRSGGFGYYGVLRSRRTVVPLRSIVAVERESRGVRYVGTIDCSENGRGIDDVGSFGYLFEDDVLRVMGCGYPDPATLVRSTPSSLPLHFDDAAHRAAHGLIERVWPGLVESEGDLSPQLARYALALYACAVRGQQFLNALELWVHPTLSWDQLMEKILDTLEQFDEESEDFSWPTQIMIRTHRDRYENFRDSGDLDPHLLEYRTCG